MKIKLKSIVEGLEFQADESHAYLNRKTGEIITLLDEELHAAEDEESADDFPDWQKEQIEAAGKVLESDEYIVLPDKFDIHEWDTMKRFCLSIEDDGIRSEMLNSIHGNGAFRYFKDNLVRYDMEDAWYGFRCDALKEIAIEWCEENGLEYE